MLAKYIVQRLLGLAGIECNGSNAWDPHIQEERFYRRVLLRPSLGLGESYVEGWWDCDRLDVFFDKLMRSGLSGLMPQFDIVRLKIREAVMGPQNGTLSRRGAEEHYSLDPEFFLAFLGKYNNYTCLRWQGASTVDEAEVQKMDLVFRKAHL